MYPKSTKYALEVKNASFTYTPQAAASDMQSSSRYIFSDVSFSLKPGQILSIIGPNGSGKSTLLNCLAALLTLTGGEIILDGKPQRSLKTKEVARIIGYVPQLYTLSYGYAVRDYVVMGCAPRMGTLATPGDAEYALADGAMERMDIMHLADRP
jgi:iron complex transport system ATP-binding protein